jgi:hypothetical protein
MFLQDIPDGIFSTTLVEVRYDCDGGFERCGKEWTLKYKDAQKNYDKNGKQHICRKCGLKNNNPASNPEVREKMKQTCLERYGTTCALNTEENTTTRVEKMFGTKEAVQEIVSKRRKTSQKRYGTGHPMKNDGVKAKLKAVFQERYGVDAPLQDPEILAKMQQTNLDRHGVANVASLPEVQVKMAKTTLERYGVEHYNQLPEMKEYLRENCPQWLKESWDAGGPNKGVPRPEEWNQKQRETVTELMMLGLWKAGYSRSHKGFCFPKNKCQKKKVYFRSSYEAIYCFYLDHHPDVEWFSFEAFRVSYEFGGKQRYYIPDFLIKWKDANKLSIKELKAEFLREDEQVKAKTSYAQLFAANNDMDFEMLCCKEIHDLGVTFDSLKEIGFVHTEE